MSLYAIAHHPPLLRHRLCRQRIFRNAGFVRHALAASHAKSRRDSPTRHVLPRRPRYAASSLRFLSTASSWYSAASALLSQPFATSFGALPPSKSCWQSASSSIRHRRRQNGTAHPDRRLVQIHPRRRVFLICCSSYFFCQSSMLLSVLVAVFETTSYHQRSSEDKERTQNNFR